VEHPVYFILFTILITYYIPSAKFFIVKFFANERKHPEMRSEDQLLLSNKSTRRSRGLLFDNNWFSDRIIYG
jgi:hypothetical protein